MCERERCKVWKSGVTEAEDLQSGIAAVLDFTSPLLLSHRHRIISILFLIAVLDEDSEYGWQSRDPRHQKTMAMMLSSHDIARILSFHTCECFVHTPWPRK